MKKLQRSFPRYLFLRIHEENVKLHFVLAVALCSNLKLSITNDSLLCFNLHVLRRVSIKTLKRKDHLPVFLDYVLKGSEEILLKAKIGQLPFFQKLHSQLTQGVHAEKRNIFVRITATLKEMDDFRILRNSNDKFPCHMHPHDEM